jgi:hypothetical protein
MAGEAEDVTVGMVVGVAAAELLGEKNLEYKVIWK